MEDICKEKQIIDDLLILLKGNIDFYEQAVKYTRNIECKIEYETISSIFRSLYNYIQLRLEKLQDEEL